MKHTVVYLLSILILWACSDKPAPTAVEGPSKHEQAIKMFNKGKSFDDCMAMQQQAIDELRAGRAPEAGFEILSQMGYFKSRAGDYLGALEYMREASDSLDAMPAEMVDAESAVQFWGNLANLYSRFGLYDQALERNDKAIALARLSYPGRLPDLLRMRGSIYDYCEQLDSAEMYIQRAVDASREVQDMSLKDNAYRFNRCCMAWFYIEHFRYAPDSIAGAVAALESIYPFVKHLEPTNMLNIGRGHALLGRPDKGLPMMEKAVEMYRNSGSIENLDYGLRLLATSYAENRAPKLLDIYSEITALHDSMMMMQRDNVLLGKEFEYGAAKLKTENRLLETRLSLNRQRTFFIVAFGLVVMVAGILFYFVRRRQHRRLMRQNRQSIDLLLTDRIRLNSLIESLNDELSKRNAEDKQAELLNLILLEKDDEAQFRRTFAELHPGFVERLRKEFPSITSGNELLCMLISLKKSNDDIALALGISRESVVTARYRLRSRFNLPKDVDLNDFIISRL